VLKHNTVHFLKEHDEPLFLLYSKSKSARAYGLKSTHISDLPIFLLLPAQLVLDN
jgi:hypothetical protein